VTPLAPDVLQVIFCACLPWSRFGFIGPVPGRSSRRGRPAQLLDSQSSHDSELLELHIRRVAGGDFTQRLFDARRSAPVAVLRDRSGKFVYRDNPGPVLIDRRLEPDLAPLKSMAEAPPRRGCHERPCPLVLGARQPLDLYENSSC